MYNASVVDAVLRCDQGGVVLRYPSAHYSISRPWWLTSLERKWESKNVIPLRTFLFLQYGKNQFYDPFTDWGWVGTGDQKNAYWRGGVFLRTEKIGDTVFFFSACLPGSSITGVQ